MTATTAVAGGVRDGRYADFYDFGVTTIDFLVRRDPDPLWSTPRQDYADDRSHILAVGLDGAADYRIGEERMVVGAGDVLLFPRGCPHGGRSVAARPFGFVSIGFDAAGPSGAVDDQLAALPRFFPGPHDLAMATVSELHAAWLLRRPGYLIQCRALLMELLHGLIREQTQSRHYSVHDRKIVAIIARLRESAEETVVVADLAAELGLSESHFRHLFKNFTGVSVKEYHHRIRISRAKELLLSGECNVTEAAARMGFNDIYYFSRLFKKIEGTSPSRYAKR